MKTVITITGIRPDFIRMSKVFKRLDDNFNHILIHTGQHYDELLSGVFFNELDIRQPDYTLNTGKECKEHYQQLAYLSTNIIELIRKNNIDPDIILFLGDSNSVTAALPLKKEGYRIGHIEAGMRSYDKRMLEEINRTICDHCSDIHFVYHSQYKIFLENENIGRNCHIVGNTIKEVCEDYIPKKKKKENLILLDIHRPENFKYKIRLKNIIEFGNMVSKKFNLSVKMLNFNRTSKYIDDYNIDLKNIDLIPLKSYRDYIETVYNSYFIISDSGTAQEEPALMNTPVIVPRDFSERPQSYENNCSYKLNVNSSIQEQDPVFKWISTIKKGVIKMNTDWLGDGNTSLKIINILNKYLNNI